MRRLPAPLAALAAVLLVAGCASTGTYLAPEYRAEPVPPLPAGDVAHRVLLTGNTGELETPSVLRAVAADARQWGEGATVVLLGDVTEGGLPDEGSDDYAGAVRPVRAVVDALAGVEAEVVVVPGDRDWARGEDGVKRLEDVLDGAFDTDVLVPGDQAGGPREWEPAEGLRLVALDTGWWLLDADDRPQGEAEDQAVRTPGDVARILEQIVVDRDDSRIVVLAHHPLESRGTRAGYRTPAQAALGLGIPTLVGRTFGLGRQDLAAPAYRQMREVLGRVVAQHDRLVWAAAHDFSLQVLRDEVSPILEQTYLVSGTGGGTAAGVASSDALYVAARPGYQRLVYFDDGRLWVEAVEVDVETGQAEVVFRREVAGAIDELVDPGTPQTVDADRLPETLGETVTVPLDAGFSFSPRFSNSALTRSLFGERYRDLWKTPVEVPVVDVGTEAGGLTPVKRSGGNQTVGLRLRGGDGHLYDFRLLEKGGTGQLPAELRDGLAADVVYELRAAAVPYGAIVTAELAEAVGVPTPKPKLVYIPDDPRLGRYRDQFGDRLATLEIRPDDDVSDVPGFEGFTDVISDESLREELREDQDHYVDQEAFLRARLLDMLVADWDRHAGQWRWGAFEPGDLDPALTGEAATQGKVYLPVPRDHDWAFYGIGGLLQPPLFLFDKRLQGIDETYNSLIGLTQNGFFQDRRFLNRLSLDDWRVAAQSLQEDLTDAEIAAAVSVLPPSIEAQIGEEWTETLQARRDGLADLAERYYGILAETVDVIGSDERELFEVRRQPGGALDVTVRSYKGGEPGRVLWARTFSPDETGEVRLYGLAGRDRFEVTGEGDDAIYVRIVAGAGADVLDAPAGDVTVYDTPGGLEIVDHGGDIEDRRSDDPDVNLYDPTEQVLGDRQYVPVVGYQPTDGFLLGLGVRFQVPGFRYRPYAATHTVSANVATTTGGVAASYVGRMRGALGRFDLAVDALASTPRYARNFYGLGNGSPDVPGDLARVDLARAQARFGLGTVVGQGARFVFGPTVRYADAGEPDPLPLVPPSPPSDDPAPAVDPARALAAVQPDQFEAQTHGGAFARLELSTANRPVNPISGVRLGVEGAVQAGLVGTAETYGRVGGEAAAYLPLGVSPQVTLALRGGAETLVGDYPFFDAAVLGGAGSLRGYRRERFAGRTAASASAELRTKLFDLDTYLLPLDVGVLGFADAGRVWADVPDCLDVLSADVCDNPAVAIDLADPDAGDGLQLGYGGGLWIGLLDRAVLNLSVGASDEATLVTFGLGFAY
jgi:hypothetical protein